MAKRGPAFMDDCTGLARAPDAFLVYDEPGDEVGAFLLPEHWSTGQAMLVLAMWVAMMIAMMLPSSSPGPLLLSSPPLPSPN